MKSYISLLKSKQINKIHSLKESGSLFSLIIEMKKEVDMHGNITDCYCFSVDDKEFILEDLKKHLKVTTDKVYTLWNARLNFINRFPKNNIIAVANSNLGLPHPNDTAFDYKKMCIGVLHDEELKFDVEEVEIKEEKIIEKTQLSFNLGDIVQHKSGGPNMVIAKIENNLVSCNYWFDHNFHEKTFTIKELKLT